MALDISGLFFFMPIFSFLFVVLIVFSILAKTKILGDSKWIIALTSFIVAVVFMSFSSADLYIRTIIPWFVVLMVVVFLVLLIALFSTKAWDKIMSPAFAWVVVGILILIFLIAAIRVFNPVLHPDLGVTSGQGTSFLEQIKDFMSGGIAGSILLLIVAVIVAWVITKK
tara:strand:- start:11862 stop:12368 length:507 start_codon:yes stop_codon:yes gene_type:complete